MSEPSARAASTRGAASSRVLLLENERDIREMLGRRIEGLGLVAVCVPCCNDALSALKEHRFAAAVLDLGMSPIDGKTCGGYIHTLYPDLPLLAYTGYPEAAGEERVMAENGFRWRFVKGRDDERMVEELVRLAGACV